MQKKFLILAFVALGLIGGAVFVWQKKTSQEVSQGEVKITDAKVVPDDWKIYRSEKYGFELYFPKDWSFSENAGDNGDRSVVSLMSPETKTLMEKHRVSETCDISFYYYDSITSEPENRDRATTIEEMISQNELVRKIGSTTLGGVNATDVVWGGNGAYYSILAIKNDHLYKVWSCNKERQEQLSPIEKKIIESFKFIEADQN